MFNKTSISARASSANFVLFDIFPSIFLLKITEANPRWLKIDYPMMFCGVCATSGLFNINQKSVANKMLV